MRHVLIIIAVLLMGLSTLKAQYRCKKVLRLMGSKFELVAIHPDSATATKAVNEAIEEIERLEFMISEWKGGSETSLLNNMAGKGPTQVSRELYGLIDRAKNVSDLTGGAFDISFLPLYELWKFDGSQTTIPDSAAIEAMLKRVNWQDITLSHHHIVKLEKPGMAIGFGGIGKGFAAESAKKVMKARGIGNGLINAGGDLVAWGSDLNRKPWKVAIASPQGNGKIAGWLTVNAGAVVTSGNYEKYMEIGGERYTHIIDPRTGWPVRGLKSVTVITGDAELADALATALFVMGEEQGMTLVNELKGIECIMITDDNRMLKSSNIELLPEG